jgi:transcription elongation factor GreA
MKETMITPGGLARLTDELDRLRTTGRDEAAERIRRAIGTDADPSANSDYLAAREEQALLESRIARLDERLAAAHVAEPDAANGIVDLGELVRLRDLDTGARFEYELVGSLEADPAASRISAESPLGRALIGRRRGEIAVVEAPKRQFRLKILAIELPEVPA